MNAQEINLDPLKAIRSVATGGLLAFSLSGCMHLLTPSTVTVDRGYESVYLALLKDARRCYPASAGAAQREVDGTLDGTTHTGRVTFSFRSTSTQETFMTAVICGTGPTQSEVDIEVARGWEPHAKAVRGWVDGTSTECV